MQQLNNELLAASQAAMRSGYEPKRKKTSSDGTVSTETMDMVNLLFTRMSDLFQSKAARAGLLIFANEYLAEQGVYTDTFKLWCRKLRDLKPEHFQAGMEALETKAEALYHEGKELWPPSYAEFRALCFPRVDFDKQAHRYVAPERGLEDKTAKENRRKLGMEQCGKLLDMLGN